MAHSHRQDAGDDEEYESLGEKLDRHADRIRSALAVEAGDE